NECGASGRIVHSPGCYPTIGRKYLLSDVIYTPSNPDPPPAPETVKAPMESREAWQEAAGVQSEPTGLDALDNRDGAFAGDEAGLWKATRALRKAREAAGGNPWVTTDGFDQKGAIVERKYPGKAGDKTLREASKDLSFTR